jgi:hypothetical protein
MSEYRPAWLDAEPFQIITAALRIIAWLTRCWPSRRGAVKATD